MDELPLPEIDISSKRVRITGAHCSVVLFKNGFLRSILFQFKTRGCKFYVLFVRKAEYFIDNY